MRATAGRAIYDSAGGEWLHLQLNPRVEDGGLQLAADKVDVSQASGDAFAHGNVKATWLRRRPGTPRASENRWRRVDGTGLGRARSGARRRREARVHQATAGSTFRGQARLWQQTNSIAAPVIVLDRTRQTLVAHGNNAADPVRVLMLSAGGADVAGKRGRPGSSTLSAENAEDGARDDCAARRRRLP